MTSPTEPNPTTRRINSNLTGSVGWHSMLPCLLAAVAMLLISSQASAATKRWTDIAGRLLATDCLRVGPNATLIIDGDAVLERLEVFGELEFEDLGPRSLEANQVRVTGSFRAGSDSAPFANSLEIRLVAGSGACTNEYRLNGPGTFTTLSPGTFQSGYDRAINVIGNGQLELYGSDPGLSWTSLTQTAAADGATFRVPTGTGWRDGDQVVLTPTDYEPDESDLVSLLGAPTAVGADEEWTIGPLGSVFSHDHYANANDDVPVFGEVGHLTRNIKIYSPDFAFVPRADRDCTAGGFAGDHLEFNGAEIRIERPVNGSANAILKHIEVFNAGKFDKLGRYPIHFHILGDGTGGHVEGVSVHRSSNRGIVVHGSTDVQILDNVVYDVVGHGYYVEQASPDFPTERNRFEHNLAVQVFGCPNTADDDPNTEEVLIVDDVNTSAFFFTDPRNAFIDNVAAGTTGAGFWWNAGNDFNDFNLCGGRALHAAGVSSQPLDTALFSYTSAYDAAIYADMGLSTICHGAFVGNTAHSAAVGLWAEEHKDVLMRVTDFTAYKNFNKALQLKNHGVTEITNLKASDNPTTLWPASHAFHLGYLPRTLLVDSVVSGESRLRPVSYPHDDDATPFYGVEVYEGNLHVARTAFYNFDDTGPAAGKRAAFGRHQTFPFYSNNPDNSIEDLTFGPGVNKLYFDDPTAETRPPKLAEGLTDIQAASGFQTVALHDLTGDIAGAGDWIVANDDFNVPGSLNAPDQGADYHSNENAWFIDSNRWVLAQLLVEWCADVTTRPRGGGDPRCKWSDSGEALPSSLWRLNATGDEFDVVDEVRFIDAEDCAGHGCADVIDAHHHPPQGNNNLMAANLRSPGRYYVTFYDQTDTELQAGGADFSHVKAMQARLRYAPAGTGVSVGISAPSAPSCVAQYSGVDMPLCQSMTQISSGLPSVGEWFFNGSRVFLHLEHGVEEQSVLMVFDPALSCPCPML